MRRVLVPLDGTDLAASILPDARRLAGAGGTLILIRAVSTTAHSGQPEEIERRAALDASTRYLDSTARTLQETGVSVEAHALSAGDAAVTIDRAAELFKADLIAIATHGRSSEERWRRGSVAWRALLRSTVPVLLRHAQERAGSSAEPSQRRILVPLDGSILAEKALPLAQALAGEWGAPLWLIHVVADPTAARDDVVRQDPSGAQAYLERLARTVPGEIRVMVSVGDVMDMLAALVDELAITDIVMTTHGRTGLTRAIVGAVADELIHRLPCPIVVIPGLAVMSDDGAARPSSEKPRY